jgi:hypothetical protein
MFSHSKSKGFSEQNLLGLKKPSNKIIEIGIFIKTPNNLYYILVIDSFFINDFFLPRGILTVLVACVYVCMCMLYVCTYVNISSSE